MRKLSKRSEEATNTVLTFSGGFCGCVCSCGCQSTCNGNAQADYYSGKARTTSSVRSSVGSKWGNR